MTQPTTPTTVGQGTQLTDLNGSWQVWPGQVSAFAQAVQQVRDNLNSVFQQVDQLTAASYQAQLGNSPVGTGLTAKFSDRLAGSEGLLANLNAVLNHLDQFVSSAEQSAAQYQETDQSTASALNTTGQAT